MNVNNDIIELAMIDVEYYEQVAKDIFVGYILGKKYVTYKFIKGDNGIYQSCQSFNHVFKQTRNKEIRVEKGGRNIYISNVN